MLRSVDYRCKLPSKDLKQVLRSIGCDTVLDIEGLVSGWGYERPMPLEEAGPREMETCDLYVDIKAHRNGPKVWGTWPRLKDKTLWYRINGGKPEHVIKSDGEDCGDEVNPPCPILTPNLWYQEPAFLQAEHIKTVGSVATMKMPEWANRAYACWPPFYRFGDYYPKKGRIAPPYREPVCLTHNVKGWGYGSLVEPCRERGIKCYGAGSPDGCINHVDVPNLLSNAIALVHVKTSDAPGYSLYESLAAGCPIVCSRSLVWKNRMEQLFEDGRTCLLFGEPSHAPPNIPDCLAEIKYALQLLQDQNNNVKIGLAGRERLKELMWDERRDQPSLERWMKEMYP
jgi:hypothetical protein